jgi:uncharacterized protein YcbX
MFISQILIYPIKSLDGVSVGESRMTPGGILEFDRVYAIVDEAGKVVNAKRTAQIQLLRTTFDSSFQEVAIWQNGESTPNHFSLTEPEALHRWLSDFFGFPVKLISETNSGFPDDSTAFGPTITSEASLTTLTEWFPEMDQQSARRRFRSNLEIGEVPPFWEDHLFGAAGELKRFQVGDVQFLGHNPCQRCAVPPRDPDQGIPLANFQKSFMELRRKHLPAWSNADRFNHYYRFAINTSVPPSEAGKRIRVGDAISIDAVRL